VLLFASYADAFGARQARVSVSAGATVSDVLQAVLAQMPGKQLPRAAVAVNQAYAPADARVNPGDEIAVIPPVAGG